jgi:acetyl esterase
MDFFTDAYLGNREAALASDFRVSPVQASSHAGLPPTTIITAERDPLRDDGRRYADILTAAGVRCTLLNYNSVHGFFTWMYLSEARAAFADAVAAITAPQARA